MSNTSVRLDPGFILTPEVDAAYRQARRFYAEQDVRSLCDQMGVQLDEWAFQEVADLYDTWQGDNPFWAHALGGFIQDVIEKYKDMDYGEGIGFTGTLQAYDVNDNRVDMWRAAFTVPPQAAAHLSSAQLEDLLGYPAGDSPDDIHAICEFVETAYLSNWIGAGMPWEWGDPFEFTVNTEQVKWYLDRLDRVRPQI